MSLTQSQLFHSIRNYPFILMMPCVTSKYTYSHIHATEIFQFFSSFHFGFFFSFDCWSVNRLTVYSLSKVRNRAIERWKQQWKIKAMTIPRIGQLLLFFFVSYEFCFFDHSSIVRRNNNSLEFWIVLINHNQFIHIISHVKRPNFIPKKSYFTLTMNDDTENLL